MSNFVFEKGGDVTNVFLRLNWEHVCAPAGEPWRSRVGDSVTLRSRSGEAEDGLCGHLSVDRLSLLVITCVVP